jgi:hypothetical protein
VDSNAAQVSDFGNKKLNDGNWHQIVCVYQCPARADHNTYPITGQVYVDGVLDVQSNGTQQDYYYYGCGSPGTSQPLYMGTDDDGATSCWNGDFCDLRFYNVALTASQVSAMYAPATRWQLYSSGSSPKATAAPTSVSTITADFGNRSANFSFSDLARLIIPSEFIESATEGVGGAGSPQGGQEGLTPRANRIASVEIAAQLGRSATPGPGFNSVINEAQSRILLSSSNYLPKAGTGASENGLDYFPAAAAGLESLLQ